MVYAKVEEPADRGTKNERGGVKEYGYNHIVYPCRAKYQGVHNLRYTGPHPIPGGLSRHCQDTDKDIKVESHIGYIESLTFFVE